MPARATPRTSSLSWRWVIREKQVTRGQWGQVDCTGVNLWDVLWQQDKDGEESHEYPGLAPHRAPSRDTSLSLSGSGAIRWPVAGTACSVPAESQLCWETLPALVINPFPSGAVKCGPPIPAWASFCSPMALSPREGQRQEVVNPRFHSGLVRAGLFPEAWAAGTLHLQMPVPSQMPSPLRGGWWHWAPFSQCLPRVPPLRRCTCQSWG